LTLRGALDGWEPESVELEGEKLVITAKEKRLTPIIYRSMIGAVCATTAADPGALAPVREVQIVNRFKATGYVFEGGQQACEEFVEMPGGPTDAGVRHKPHPLVLGGKPDAVVLHHEYRKLETGVREQFPLIFLCRLLLRLPAS
jgi:hypothetical protein